ncbi:MAG TPA: hypothetical protein H9773_08610 [Candidatus Fournierella merdavium]|uniref:hypothetical protein n=1 Tax=Candidatus Allofournierella merdavium TaxID=2838593 RepID=UPI001F859717|nr:hypothetical protein [Candidatus Fournierella merdavium]
MEENFDLLAQSRANYFTKGSPVQFVKVELLKGDVSGDIAVCLSFKNITANPLTQLQITFKCKDRSGAVVCQDQFVYEGLNASHGEVFGADDAVYISSSPIGSVEVELGTARFADGSAVDLTGYPRVRLTPPKKLPPELAEKLCERTRKEGLTVVPQVLDEGWYCACGAFHPREEDGVWCSECGSDRILLQNTLSSLLQSNTSAPATDDEPTRMVPPVRQEEPTRAVPPLSGRPAPAAPVEEDDDVIVAPPRRAARPAPQPAAQPYASRGQYQAQDQYEEEYDEPEEDPRDVIAGRIIRWAPPITAVLCAIIAAVGFILTL